VYLVGYAAGTLTSVVCLSGGGGDSSRLNADHVDADAAARLARSEAQQNLPDRGELGGVDERIGADVQECDDHRGVVASAGQRLGRVELKKQHEDVVGQPRDGVERADEQHRLNDVALSLM